MNEEFLGWFRRYWALVREWQDRSPERDEWRRLIREAASSPEDPLCGSSLEELEGLIPESFRTLDIWDAMLEDLHLKFRAAYTNSYCRKYVDGSF